MRSEDVAAQAAQRLKNCVGCVNAKRANHHAEPPPPVDGCECYKAGQNMLAAVAPAIRAAERERCAVVAENWAASTEPEGEYWIVNTIAAAIRAMKETTT